MMTNPEMPAKEKQTVEGSETTRAGRAYVPDVDIYEDEEGLWLWADMPGVEQNSVEVEIDDEVLRIDGLVNPTDYEGLAPVYSEYNVGNYARRFTLGNAGAFDQSKISARMVNGVLELHLAKAEKAKPRRIPIAVEG